MKQYVSSLLKKVLVITMVSGVALSFAACKKDTPPDDKAEVTDLVIETPPDKVEYFVGETFDSAGMTLKAEWSDGRKLDVNLSECTFAPSGPLSVTDTEITVTYSTVSAKQPIKVKAVEVDRLTITTPPTKISYKVGEKFDPAGMAVKAIMNNGTEKEVALKDCEITPAEELTVSDTKVTVKYGGKTVEQAIEVKAELTVESIKIATAPKKLEYIAGDKFDPAGMVIKAVLSDGTEKEIALKDCVITPAGALTVNDTEITVAYGELTVKQSITVKAVAVDNLTITTAPTKVKYIAGETFDPAGMVVKAIMNNKTEKEVALKDCVITPSGALTAEDTKVTVTYDGKSVEQAIEVRTIDSIKIATAPTKVLYLAGEKFDPTGMVVKAVLSDNSEMDIDLKDCEITPDGELTAEDTEVTVAYGKLTAKQSITVKNVEVERLTIETAPTKVKYLAGDKFDPAGMVVKAHLSDNSDIEVELKDCEITPDGALAAEDTKITVTYRGKSAEQAIEVLTISSIKIATEPTKVTYRVGETFDPAGMVVKAVLSDNSEMAVDLKDCLITPDSELTVDDTEINVKFKDFTAKLTITVMDVEGITVDTGKMQLSGATFTPIDFSQIKVIANYQDGSTKELSEGYTFSVDGKEIEDITHVVFEKGGNVEIVVSYGKHTDSFTMEIFNGFIIEAENFKKPADIQEGDKNFVEQVKGSFGKRDSATASGGQYLGQIFKGNIMRFHVYVEHDGFANIILWASSCYMLVDGGSWDPLEMGDMQFNRVFSVKYGSAQEAEDNALKDLEVDDEVILPGGKTDDFNRDNLYTNWKDVSFGNIPLKAGDNIIELTVTSDYVNCKGEKVACNIDRFEVQYTESYIPPAQVESIEIKTAPDKTEYIEGETFDPTGMVIEAKMDNGTTRTVNLGRCTFTPDGELSNDVTKITIIYKGKTVEQKITVLTVDSLSITTPPAKTSYLVGERFNPTGMVISANMSNGSEKVIDIADCTVIPNGALKADDTEVTILYSGKEVKQAITVDDGIVVMEAENLVKQPTENDKYYTEAVRNGYQGKPGSNSTGNEAYGTSGGKYLNGLFGSADGKSGAIVRFHIHSDVARKATIKIWVSSCNMTQKGSDESSAWAPSEMGDVVFNKVFAVKFGATAENLSDVTIADDVIVKGGKTDDGTTNRGLWENWREITLGTFDLVVGDNIIELENINTEKNKPGEIYGMNIDKLVIEFKAQ